MNLPEHLKIEAEEAADKADKMDYSHCSDSGIVIGFNRGVEWLYSRLCNGDSIVVALTKTLQVNEQLHSEITALKSEWTEEWFTFKCDDNGDAPPFKAWTRHQETYVKIKSSDFAALKLKIEEMGNR